jgi:5-methylcytosine-specific restriction enzyme A
MRQEFNRRTKLQALDRTGENCAHCGGDLRGKRVEYDHRIPCELGGTNDLSNCDPLCVPCHKIKTAADAVDMAKARSVRAKHFGAHKPKRPMATSRNGPYRKRLDGVLVWRDTGEPV